MPRKPTQRAGSTRRQFIGRAGAIAAALSAAPALLRAEDKASVKLPIMGEGEHTYEAHHDFGNLPDDLRWGDTHGVAIDEQGHIYVKHRSDHATPIDAIVVFDAEGKYVRSFGKEFHGGGHGIDIRKESGEEFLYLCDIHRRLVVKTNLKGEVVWQMGFPKECGKYQSAEQFRPTNVAFHPDGGFYVGDGYGSHWIHQYDTHAKWVRTFGGAGSEPGQVKVPHGLWVDTRNGTPKLIVADRANARVQLFTLDGNHISYVKSDFRMPAHFDIRGEWLLVPDLQSRVTILNGKNEPIAQLGGDEVSKLRGRPRSEWIAGKFIHPHDACFDRDGNIYVVEWVPIGRVTKLVRKG